MGALSVAQQHHGVGVMHNGHDRLQAAPPDVEPPAPPEEVETPAPPGTPPVETEVFVRGTGPAASYSVAFSGPIQSTRQLESSDRKVNDRVGEGSVAGGDVDVWAGRAGVVRVTNAAGSDGPIEVEMQGRTFTVAPGDVAARRFVPGPVGPLQLPETVLGVRSDAAVAGGAAVGLGTIGAVALGLV